LQASLDIVEVNVTALVELTYAAANTLRREKKSGVILNVSSVVSFTPYPYSTVYAATKAFVTSFSRAVDVEVREYGIRVLTACPGAVSSGFQDRAFEGKRQDIYIIKKVTMTPEVAAQKIIQQIQKRKTITSFNWFFVILKYITYFTPLSFIRDFLKKQIKKNVH